MKKGMKKQGTLTVQNILFVTKKVMWCCHFLNKVLRFYEFYMIMRVVEDQQSSTKIFGSTIQCLLSHLWEDIWIKISTMEKVLTFFE
ncbi:hypothetical protein GIB67_010691 [Kingdonia uniflora]|uniref:Uncharacterized protein n=1 Tax=Kingdonia uniflora TaxID=39325 RepID=A0A7J7L8J8_9MAGN|nr:hypothetical protein GIB67_010691 [Kingdonia uniflora]